MLTIKKLFFLFQFLATMSFSFSIFSVFSAENTFSTHEQLINKIEHLSKQNSEDLSYDEIVNLSNKVIFHRNSYPNKIIAKTYLLLAKVAINKGELENAFQFVQDGLAIKTSDQNTKLCLQITLAEVLSAKKHYQKLLIATEEAINVPTTKENIKYLLFALSYRSVAYSMLSEHGKALQDLQQVQSIIKQNPMFSEHVLLLSILANAYYHLGEFQTALTIQLKILKLRFNLNKLENISQTYYHLANAYFNLHKYNDAYNAYWEAKIHAEKKSTPIHVAYAKQGLGLTLFQQKQHAQAQTELLQARQIFQQYNLTVPYIETLISLAQIANETVQFSASFDYLQEAEKVSTNLSLSSKYIIFYQLLAQMYLAESNPKKAYYWQEKYSQSLIKNSATNQNTSINMVQKQSSIASNKTRKLAIKLAEQSELTSVYSNKYRKQQLIIFTLIFIILSVVSSQLLIRLWRRAKRSTNAYDAQEEPNPVLSTPAQTKQLYQTNFNMARKYSYPISLGYISIGNWEELTLKFSKKTMREVNVGITDVINEHINDFESAGIINTGEYLLFFPHQTKEEASMTMEKLLQALKLRIFANLGGSSVTFTHSLKSPDFQDIDPYVFLSQLSAAVKSTSESE